MAGRGGATPATSWLPVGDSISFFHADDTKCHNTHFSGGLVLLVGGRVGLEGGRVGLQGVLAVWHLACREGGADDAGLAV